MNFGSGLELKKVQTSVTKYLIPKIRGLEAMVPGFG